MIELTTGNEDEIVVVEDGGKEEEEPKWYKKENWVRKNSKRNKEGFLCNRCEAISDRKEIIKRGFCPICEAPYEWKN